MGILPQRPLYRRLLLLFGLIGIALVGLGGWAIYTRASFGERIAAIRAAGDPAVIADLRPKPISSADNAAAQLLDAAPRLNAFVSAHGRFFKTPVGIAYDKAHDAGQTISPEQIDAIRAIVEKYPDLDAAFVRAAACPRYASPLDFSLPHPQFSAGMMPAPIDIRGIARYIVWQMELATAGGRSDVAVEKGIELLRLAALYDAEPGLVSSQVAMAVRGVAAAEIYDALSTGPISSALHQELDQELARFDAEAALTHALKTERAIAISAIQDQLGGARVGGARAIIVNTVGLPMKKMYLNAIDYYEPVLAVAQQPWHDVFQNGKPAAFQKPTGFGVLADLLATSLEAQFQSVHRMGAVLRSLRVYNALLQFTETNGHEASGLAELNLPAEATTDPFTGQQLMTKQIDGGWIVYSVGNDGVDDGGEFETQKDFGVGPAKRGE
jgi:hypothetical protein